MGRRQNGRPVISPATHDRPKPVALLEVPWHELEALVSLHRVSIAPTSPLRLLLDDYSPGSSATPTGQSEQQSAAWALDALHILAAPRQLLTLDCAARADAPAMLVNDGHFLVRFDVGSDGVSLSPPCTHRQFAGLIVDLVQPGESGSRSPAIHLTKRCLHYLIALADLGIFDEHLETVTRHAAESAVRSVDTREPHTALEALQAEEFILLEDALARANPVRLAVVRSLVSTAALSLHAVELADAVAGRSRREAVSLTGDRARSIYIPPTDHDPDHDVLLEALPATRDGLCAAVQRLLEPPAAPPRRPTIAYDGATAKLLNDPGHAAETPQWRNSTIEQIVAPTDSDERPPGALLSPTATIEIVTREVEASWGRRYLFAFDRECIVEWALEGSLVSWRKLDAGYFFERVRELIPAPNIRGSRAMPIDHAAWKSLFTHNTMQSAHVRAPADLHPLAAADGMTTSTVGISRMIDGTLETRELLLVWTSSDAWQLASAEAGYTASSIIAADIRDAILDALSLDSPNT